MSDFYSGQHGAFYMNGNKTAAVRAWSFSTTSAILATTTLGDVDSSAIYGVRNTTGTATLLFYKHSDGKTNMGLVEKLVKASGKEPAKAELRLFWGEDGETHAIRGDALITNATMTCSVGEVLQAQVTYQFTGSLTEASL
nr:phage major tail protein 2 [uncultured Mediterranean phage uvMED]